jgi:hypothetical protein
MIYNFKAYFIKIRDLLYLKVDDIVIDFGGVYKFKFCN